MTREEARTALGDRNHLLWGMSQEEKKYYSEALDMAISALEKNESAEEWYKLLCEKWDSADNKGEWIYSDLLRVKHGTMNIDSLIDKVYADMKRR